MQKRTFGNSGEQVSQLGLGCMGMSEFYGSSDDSESINVIRYAIDNGINFFDTADMYGVGRNEVLLGKAFEGKREANHPRVHKILNSSFPLPAYLNERILSAWNTCCSTQRFL